MEIIYEISQIFLIFDLPKRYNFLKMHIFREFILKLIFEFLLNFSVCFRIFLNNFGCSYSYIFFSIFCHWIGSNYWVSVGPLLANAVFWPHFSIKIDFKHQNQNWILVRHESEQNFLLNISQYFLDQIKTKKHAANKNNRKICKIAKLAV